MKTHPFRWFGLLVLLAVFFAASAPLEKTLGANARLIYLHGAWVWAGMFAFLAAALTGLAAFALRRPAFHSWSQAWGRTGLFFWLLFLPMSLYTMQVNWGGLFLDEPRWQIPLNLAVVGLLLQIGLAFFPVQWSSAGNLLFGLIFFGQMRTTEAILHPESPIFHPEAGSIRFFFLALVGALSLAAFFFARGLHRPNS